jgi:ketosteroid isomerase-like protein
MSQENVERVRSIYEATNRRDWDAVFRDLHPDVEVTTPRGSTPARIEGAWNVRGYWEELLAPFFLSARER